MDSQERFVVPILGAVIILAVIILGVPLVYKVFLGLLGAATVATYFAPRVVQVETRIAIAALGLVILLIVSSTAFWITLLAFSAIAALQFPHRDILQRNPATIEWLSSLIKSAKEHRSGSAEASGDADEEAAVATNGNGTQASSMVDTLPAFVRMNVAGIASVVAGVLVLIGVFMPWVGFSISGYEDAGSLNLTLREADGDLQPWPDRFFYLLIAVGILSIISIALPRIVAAVIATAGLIVTFASYFYFLEEVDRGFGDYWTMSPGVTTLPATGAAISGICLLITLVLQFIPSANTSRGAG